MKGINLKRNNIIKTSVKRHNKRIFKRNLGLVLRIQTYNNMEKRGRRTMINIKSKSNNNSDLIFRTNKEKLKLAKQRCEENLKRISENTYTEEQKLERVKLDIEIFESMKILRERANLCQNIIE